MDIRHHTLRVPRTAHVLLSGPTVKQDISQCWIACHGYAQLAADFLNDLRPLQNGRTLILAPEGMNYFYKKGFSGDVGANWMTKHQRQTAIDDNAEYLQAVYETALDLTPANCRIILLGFSQGTATLCRWIVQKKPRFHDLVLWAGLPPEDIDYQLHKDYLGDKNLYLLYGANDPFLTEERMHLVQQIEQESGLDFGERSFDGGHEIPASELLALQQKLG